MDYDEMTDHIVDFEVGALYYIAVHGQHMLTLYTGRMLQSHIFYVYSKNRSMHISNSLAIRMRAYITKVETDVTVTAR